MNTLTNNNLYLDNSCLGAEMLLVQVSAYHEYRDNVRQDTVLGYKYTVVLPRHGYEQLDVKIPGGKLLDVEAGSSIPVAFDNLRVRPYISYRGKAALAYTAQADGIRKIGEKH